MGFDSPDLGLNGLLTDIAVGKIQLPDFQREWKWDDDRIRSLLASIARGHPVGVLMMLQVDGDRARFAPKPVAGVDASRTLLPADRLILDGQQRLTSLFQSLAGSKPVDTTDSRGKRIERHYYIRMLDAIADDADVEEAIISVPADKLIKDQFGRSVVADYSSVDRECAAEVFPLSIAFDMPRVFAWQNRYLQVAPEQSAERSERWNRFYSRVLDNFVQYTVPTIVLSKDTPKEAVCTIFEKVNTGGVPLNVFELLTAMFGRRVPPEGRLDRASSDSLEEGCPEGSREHGLPPGHRAAEHPREAHDPCRGWTWRDAARHRLQAQEHP